MQVLKLTWVPTNQVFDRLKTFEEAMTAAIAKVQRSGCRCFGVSVGDDGDSFRIFRHSDDTDDLVRCDAETRDQGSTSGVPSLKRSFLQNIQGKPPASGWYKGLGRRYDLAVDPKVGPYFLVLVDADDKPLFSTTVEPEVRAAANQGAEYPLDVALASNKVRNMIDETKGDDATFVLVVRDDNPPKLRFKDKWDGSARSMQVVYRRPL